MGKEEKVKKSRPVIMKDLSQEEIQKIEERNRMIDANRNETVEKIDRTGKPRRVYNPSEVSPVSSVKLVKKKKFNIFRFLSYIFIALAVGLGSWAYLDYKTYTKNESDARDLADEMVVTADTKPSAGTQPGIDTVPDDNSGGTLEKLSAVELNRLYGNIIGNLEEDDPLFRRIDFNKLMNRNPDARSWIYVPDTSIDYAVMQEPVRDEFAYLWHDIDHEYSKLGSILTPKVEFGPDELAYLTLFGHNSSQGNFRFAEIDNYLDKEYRDARPYVYMYYPDHAERWKIWTGFNTTLDHDLYRLNYKINTTPYADLLKEIANDGEFFYGEPIHYNQHMLILSTCDYGYIWERGRFVLMARPDAFYYYKSSIITNGLRVNEDEILEQQRIQKQNLMNTTRPPVTTGGMR